VKSANQRPELDLDDDEELKTAKVME